MGSPVKKTVFFGRDAETFLFANHVGMAERDKSTLESVRAAYEDKEGRFTQEDVDTFTPLILARDFDGMFRAVLQHLERRNKSQTTSPPVRRNLTMPRLKPPTSSMALTRYSGGQPKPTLFSRLGGNVRTWITDPCIAAWHYVVEILNSQTMADFIIGTLLVLVLCFVGYMLCSFSSLTGSPPVTYQGIAGSYSVGEAVMSAADSTGLTTLGTNLANLQGQVKDLGAKLEEAVNALKEFQGWKNGVNNELYGDLSKSSDGLVSKLSYVNSVITTALVGSDSPGFVLSTPDSETRESTPRYYRKLGKVLNNNVTPLKLSVDMKRSFPQRVAGVRLMDPQIVSELRGLVLQVNASMMARFSFLEMTPSTFTDNAGSISNFGVLQKFGQQVDAISSMNTRITALENLSVGRNVQPQPTVSTVTEATACPVTQETLDALMRRLSDLEQEVAKNRGQNTGAFTMGLCVLSGMALASVTLALANPNVMATAMMVKGISGTAVYGIAKFFSLFGLHSATRSLELFAVTTGAIAN